MKHSIPHLRDQRDLRPAIPTELLLRLMNATPDQLAAVEGVLASSSVEVASPPEPVSEDVARKAFALIHALDSEGVVRTAPVLTVFRFYCMEGLSPEQVAGKCGCSKGTVVNRLRLIREKTGVAPAALRRFSSQFEKIEDDIRDSRAAYVHRRRLIDEDGDEEDGD
jgi:DNA-directed RNA polymerase specialized sigma24 family protein